MRRIIRLSALVIALAILTVLTTPLPFALAVQVILGLAAGAVFAAGRFSFAGGWRTALSDGSTRGLRIQIALVAALGLAVMPLVSGVFGEAARGHVAPIGVPLVLGAALFGAGMRLARRCASGALWTAGTGDLASLATIAGLFIGATAAAATHADWSRLPLAPALSMPQTWGLGPAFLAHLTLAGLFYLAAVIWETRRRGAVVPIHSGAPGTALAAIGLFAIVVAVFAILGRPWTIISAFANWGTRLAETLGADAWSWSFWAPNLDALETPLSAEPTSLTNLAIVAGATLAALALSRLRLRLDRGLPELAQGFVGGAAMGFGALLSSGCNIASLLGAIPSGSLHGWVWFAAAFFGFAIAHALEAAALRLRSIASATFDAATAR